MTNTDRFLKSFLAILIIFGAAFVIVSVASGRKAHAQTAIMPISIQYPPCTVLPYSLGIGRYDTTNVTALQTFLSAKGYLNHVPTGYFGGLTFQATVRFQAEYGIARTGFVGPITRAQIQALTCGVVPPTPSPVTITSMTPSSGATGTQVTLAGSGFTANNTIYFGGASIGTVSPTTINYIVCPGHPNCTNSYQQLTFTVPSAITPQCAVGMMCAMYARLVTPGSYEVSVGNEYGTSNVVKFMVTDSSNTQSLSISGIDAPTSIAMGTTGTWTVRTTGSHTGTRRYSVTWGDEGMTTSSGAMMAPVYNNYQSSATFTHSYSRAGTYNPTFTVTDDYGNTVSTSSTITVTPWY